MRTTPMKKTALCAETELVRGKCGQALLNRIGSDSSGWSIMGDSTMFLQPWLGKSCLFFTIFREPVARLLSSYRFCQRSRSDHLCGTIRLDARSATLQEWARHQRGFVYLRLALGNHTMLHKILGNDNQFAIVRRTFSGNARRFLIGKMKSVDQDDDDDDYKSHVPTWLRLAPHFLQHDASKDPIFLALTQALASNQLFSAVGILERPQDTGRLFDARIPLPHGKSWLAALQNTHHNSILSVSSVSLPLDNANDPIQTASNDSIIRSALDYDVPLYEAAQLALERGLSALT